MWESVSKRVLNPWASVTHGENHWPNVLEEDSRSKCTPPRTTAKKNQYVSFVLTIFFLTWGKMLRPVFFHFFEPIIERGGRPAAAAVLGTTCPPEGRTKQIMLHLLKHKHSKEGWHILCDRYQCEFLAWFHHLLSLFKCQNTEKGDKSLYRIPATMFCVMNDEFDLLFHHLQFYKGWK